MVEIAFFSLVVFLTIVIGIYSVGVIKEKL